MRRRDRIKEKEEKNKGNPDFFSSIEDQNFSIFSLGRLGKLRSFVGRKGLILTCLAPA